MSRTIMLVPTSTNVGLTSIRSGLIRAMECKGICVRVFSPVLQLKNHNNLLDNIPSSNSLEMSYVESLLSSNQKDVLMEEIISNYYYHTDVKDNVVLIEGLIPNERHQFVQFLNYEIAKIFNAEIVFVLSQNGDSIEQLKNRIELIRNNFGNEKHAHITGIIVNKLNAPLNRNNFFYLCHFRNTFNHITKTIEKIDFDQLQNYSALPVIGAIPWNFYLTTVRIIDIIRYLNAVILNEGDINTRRVGSLIFCVQNLSSIIDYFHTFSLLVIPSDRPDVFIAACLSTMNGMKVSAILLTGKFKIDSHINKLCKQAFSTGLPVFMVNSDILQTFVNLQKFDIRISTDDKEHREKVQKYVMNHISADWIKSLTITSSKCNHRLYPLEFRYRLTEFARRAEKCIVLPEGDEPRTIRAAAICAERGIASCVLLGNTDKINHIASLLKVELRKEVKIIDPDTIRENYISRLVELRRNKGMTEDIAKKQLEDNVVLGTLMLDQNEVDGLVSGAVHTTANTIRPPLQLIKTAPGNSLVSSIFFMLLPEEVYVYGDCAINLNPTAEQLAEIAIQSADSATAFGIEPRVAMLSYSTGNSGTGSDVEKVYQATLLAKEKRPDLLIDGPIQYDAAVMIDVAKLKAPNSPVAGCATVFIFPDLNTGNITYKAVQRSANLISIGPILQGMRKPVNDLSRGALVADIVYTIAITAVQAAQKA